LLSYLSVTPDCKKFKPTVFRKERMLAEVEAIRHQPGAEHRNRLGILLGNKITEDSTLTLTHTLWSLLNMLPAGDAQRPHRHNSVAIDLCVSASPNGGVYTLMGPELGADGWVKDPIRCDWVAGGAFVTPPGWW
jgi:gentisate 1,2-dioxygenase